MLYLFTLKSLNVDRVYKILLIFLLFLSSCTPTTYYIVRHAEKQTSTPMAADILLTKEGEERALALRDSLKDKGIKHIYSTVTTRTKATARPLSEATGVSIETYEAKDTTFVTYVKSRGKGNVLIVGHSNTVDDIVNGLTGRKLLSDLPETQYGDLFIVTRRGKNYFFSQSHFGK